MNATELMDRVQDMQCLTRMLAAYLDDPLRYRIVQSVKKANFPFEWGIKQDSMLLYGAYKYGRDNLEKILKDQELELNYQASTEPEEDAKLKVCRCRSVCARCTIESCC